MPIHIIGAGSGNSSSSGGTGSGDVAALANGTYAQGSFINQRTIDMPTITKGTLSESILNSTTLAEKIILTTDSFGPKTPGSGEVGQIFFVISST